MDEARRWDWRRHKATAAAQATLAALREQRPTQTRERHYAEVASLLKVALEQLPGTAEGIALWLDSLGVKGFTCTSGLCPMSMFLTYWCRHEVEVGRDFMCALHSDWSLQVRTPPVIREFVEGFDSEEWPYLLLPGDVPLGVVRTAKELFKLYAPPADRWSSE